MRFSTLISILWTILILSTSVSAQQNEKLSTATTNVNSQQAPFGSIKGVPKDSTYRYLLKSATISIYTNSDSLLKFTLPNNLGEFSLQQLPLNSPLKMVVTHVGYTPLKKTFNLTLANRNLNLDTIFMHQNSNKENTIEEVAITALAPVRMNADTIEFNPRAFKMGANATTEDLMRLLPGIVIWGDGDITYNGKKIQSLLVDGKPFMGGDFATATQNLPKDVLDKVQIYRQENKVNPLDSTMHANLKLRDDMKIGHFGKIGVGYGTGDRYAADGMMNSFNKKMQLSIIGATNNVNKSANSISSLIRSNSYKGEGNTVDYQSDFRRAGINQGTTVGSIFQYDFIQDPNSFKSKRLTADYNFRKNKETISSNFLTNTMLDADSILSNLNNSTRLVTHATNNFSAKYEQTERDYRFSVSALADINKLNSMDNRIGETTRTGTSGLLGADNSNTNDDNTQTGFTFNTAFSKDKSRFEQTTKRNPFDRFSINYTFQFKEDNADKQNYSSITSLIDPSMNKIFDRSYQNHNTQKVHTINIAYPDFKKLIFGTAYLAGINIQFDNYLKLNQYGSNSLVTDANEQTNQHEVNTYLTNSSDNKTHDFQSKLVISKSFNKGLTNRYMKSFEIKVSPGIQYYGMQNIATQSVQNLKYNYNKFIPNAYLEYSDHQYGAYLWSSSLSYNTRVDYATVQHLAPLVDSTDTWYIPKGNLALQPEYRSSFQCKVNLESRTAKNPYQITAAVDYNSTANKIADSIFYDNIGRRINYNVNLDGNEYWQLQGTFRKSFSPNKNNTLRFGASYNRFIYLTPQYINSVLIKSKNNTSNIDFEIAYSYLDKLNLTAKQGFSLYKNTYTNKESYSGENNYTSFSGTLYFPKNVIWSTNINLNSNKAGHQPTVNYTIWNASLAYRFLKGNTGEVKLSALDILNENKSIINRTNQNIQTFGFNNVLRQYFMLTLAYYPRKFGK